MAVATEDAIVTATPRVETSKVETSNKATPKKSGRLVSLDVFRGMTIIGMVIVNNPGTWSAIYPPLDHAEWNGWTPTDLIFPFFLFIVGISITLALGRRVEQGDAHKLTLKIIKRALVIYGCGLFLNLFPFLTFPASLSTVRLTGVLQRIAVCYLITSLIFISTRWRAQMIIAAALLVVYWLALTRIPTPEIGAGVLTKEGSIASYIDRSLLGNHIWKGGDKIYDPEGILSTLGALATTLAGVLTGHILRSRHQTLSSPIEKVTAMFVAGACCIALGWTWNFWLPINKALWTSSYVLFTTGIALQLLALCYWFIDIKNYRRWTYPFVVFGVNALALFVLTGLVARLLTTWKIPRADDKPGNAQTYIFDHIFTPMFTDARIASLAYAICFLLVFYGIMWFMYKKNIIIKA